MQFRREHLSVTGLVGRIRQQNPHQYGSGVCVNLLQDISTNADEKLTDWIGEN